MKVLANQSNCSFLIVTNLTTNQNCRLIKETFQIEIQVFLPTVPPLLQNLFLTSFKYKSRDNLNFLHSK